MRLGTRLPNLPRSDMDQFMVTGRQRLGARKSQDTSAAVPNEGTVRCFFCGSIVTRAPVLLILFLTPPLVSRSSSNYFHNSVIQLFYGLRSIAISESPHHGHCCRNMDTVRAGFSRLALNRATATASPVNHYKVASGSVEVLHLRRVLG